MDNHIKRTFLSVVLAGCFGGAGAAPALPQVVAGQATFGQQGNVFTVTNTPNAIINWQSFSVNAGEITRFVQQSADSAVLNRITGQDPSAILGALQSNGHVFLINPNGVMFGRDARIDVNGLTASSLALSDADFLAGRRNFTAGAGAGSVANHGTVTTPEGGKVFLIAPNVENTGVITSPKGEVVLAAGHAVQLVDSANPDLRVVVSAPSGQSVNLGRLVAQGGKIGIYGALVRQRGVVNANSAVRGEGGRIIFKASGDTLLEAGSVTSATGAGRGGHVSVLGERVALLGDARIDASGVDGGGTVLVGGDYQGSNAQVQNARQTWMGKDASIRADASASGDGGKVVLWSNDATRAFGSISARGAASGNGGLVETSGHYLDVAGARVDTRGAAGRSGSWLLDPLNIEIATGGPGALADADLFSETPAATTRIAPALLNTATTRVVLQAINDISILNAVAVASPAGSLTFQAGGNINVNAALTTNGGALTLSANHAGFGAGAGGSVNVNAPVATNGGKFSASGHQISFAANASSGAGDMDLRAVSLLSLNAGASLSSGGYIDIMADNVAIGGSIGAAGSRPNVSFTPYTASRNMSIAVEKSGTDLSLTPAELNRIAGYAINLGSSANTGTLSVSANYVSQAGATPNLVLESGGSIVVGGAIDLASNHAGASHAVLGRFGGSDGSIELLAGSSVKSANIAARADNMSIGGLLDAGATGNITLAPNNGNTHISLGGAVADSAGMLGLSNAELAMLRSGSLTIGGNDGQAGGISIGEAASIATAGKVTLDAGTGNLAFNSVFTTADLLSLKSANRIIQETGAIITAPAVEARAALVDLSQANAVGVVAGAASTGTFDFGAAGNLAVGVVGGSTGVTTSGGGIDITAGGLLSIDKAVNAGAGTVSLGGNGVVAGAQGSARADSVFIRSGAGVGTDSNAFPTFAQYLWVDNNHQGGASPVNLSNTGDLVIGSVLQSGAGSTGSIRIANSGSVSLPYLDPQRDARAYVRAEGGDVRIAANGPLTIDGEVASQSGSIALVAGNGGLLKIGTGGAVRSDTGNVSLTGSTIANNGSVTAPGGSVSSVETSVPTTPEVPPTPPVEPPAPKPPTLDQCIATPTAAGCAAVLPTLSQCAITPTLAGCSVVLPSLAQCTVTPSLAGCAAVLPTLAQCTITPSLAGCVSVLPTLAQCTAGPAQAGCASVLPSIAQCAISPTLAGCSAVLPTLAQCTITPSLAGCASVLPSIAQCAISPTLAGCSAVLPTLLQCVVSPTAAGCSLVLPTLSQCAVTPTLAGCSVVLPTLSQCAAMPTLGGCSSVLPTLPQCMASPSLAGCGAVLPTLSQCTATPSLAACAVVLPTLQQCAASPGLQGCTAVLPAPDTCLASPNLPACIVVSPAPAAEPVQNSLAAVIARQATLAPNSPEKSARGPDGPPPAPVAEEKKAAPAAKEEEERKPAEATLPIGVKDEAKRKTYCN
ncbi:MAG: two-partner secretion domain-containing protein [Telluria sp.]